MDYGVGPIGFKTSYSSQSGWERSHFGGVKKLIWDYPMVNTSWRMDIDSKTDQGLTAYESNKLAKILLSKAKQNGISLSNLLDKSSVEIEETPMGKYAKMKTKPNAMRDLTNMMIKCEPEFAPLFDEYKDTLASTELTVKVPADDMPGESGESGEGESKEGESGEGEGNPGSCSSGEGGEGEGKSSEGKGKGEGEGEDKDGEGGEGSSKDANAGMSREEIEAKIKEILGKIMKDIAKEIENVTEGSTYGRVNPHGTYGSFRGSSRKLGKFDREVIFKIPKKTTKPDTFSQDEKFYGEQLLKMLDITWDPDIDTVKSLRTGKIDIDKIAEVPAGNMAVYKRDMEEQTTKPFTVVILMDESGSMGNYHGHSKYRQQYHLVKSLYVAFSQLLPADKLWIYGHSGCYDPTVYTYQDPYNPNFAFNVQDMKSRDTCQNYDGPVIEAVHKKVREYTEDRILFIVTSDGSPCGDGYGTSGDVNDMKKIVERARRDEFVTAAIYIQYGGMKDLYTHTATVQDLESMPKTVSHLLNKVVKTEFQ